MANKYLTKIASHGISEDLRNPDFLRIGAKSGFYGAVGAGLGHVAGKALRASPGGVLKNMLVGAGTGVGLASGLTSSVKNQLKEQQVHDIKLQGAAQRQEMHEQRLETLRKHAADSSDPNKLTKDVVNTGIIAGLGGIGTVAASKATTRLLPRVQKMMPSVTHNKLLGGLGVGVGLVADYAGLQASEAANKHIDRL